MEFVSRSSRKRNCSFVRVALVLFVLLCATCKVNAFEAATAAQVQKDTDHDNNPACTDCNGGGETSENTRNEPDRSLIPDEAGNAEDSSPSTDTPSEEESELAEENGIKVLTRVDSFLEALTSPMEKNHDVPTLLLTVVYTPSCPHSQGLIKEVEQAVILTSRYMDSIGVGDSTPPVFGKMDVTHVDQTWLQEQLQMESVPALLFVRGKSRGDGNDMAVDLIDYEGLQSTPLNIFHTVLHFWYRFSFGSLFSYEKALISDAGEKESKPNSRDNPVFTMSSYGELEIFMSLHGNGLLHALVPASPPEIGMLERRYMEWLLNQEQYPDPLHLFIQCRSNHLHPDSYQQYSNLAYVMAQRRDVAFFAVTDCNGVEMDKDGKIVSLMVNDGTKWTTDVLKELSRTAAHFIPNASDEKSMEHFIMTQATPLVLWYDRKTVAPMAFPLYRHVHAVLFVDMHKVMDWEESEQKPFADVTSNMQSLEERNAIRNLRKACETHRRQVAKLENNNSGNLHDMVCLVVPSTETRIMNTFGVDIWTPLDTAATSKNQPDEEAVPTTVLPTLLITDSRFGGTRRYYLQANDIVKGVDEEMSAIERFITDFWDGQLTSYVQSRKDPPTMNESGVKVFTGDTFEELVLDRPEKHTLVYFYAPTCGHCKRFSILWNELSRLVRHLEWDFFLELAKMDVTQNEISGGDFLDIQVVPEVYYFPLGDKSKAVKYDVTDELGDGVGRLSDPLDVLEWLLDVSEGRGGLTEEALLHLMADAEGGEEI